MRTGLRTSLSVMAAALLCAHAAIAQTTNSLLSQPMAPEQFNACVQQLAQQTPLAGRPLSRADFESVAATARYDDRVRQSMQVAAGEPTFIWDELAATTDAERVQQGRAILSRDPEALQRIEQQFGVPKEIVVAIYGIETNYGPAQGRIPVVDAAFTYACLRPCPETATAPGSCISRERVYATARLVRDRKVPPEGWVGSWAAAFGRTQFVPDSFEQLAVDFDGDGISNIIQSERDAWATTANHLKQRGGWAMGVPVYIEVAVPPTEQAPFATGGKPIRLQDRARRASEWAAAGWAALGPNGQRVALQLAGDPELYPYSPAGMPGPVFLVSRNFDTILRYNRSHAYALEVAHLAHKIAGGGDFVTPWPTDDPGLSRAEVRQLQEWLVSRGHTQVTPDGVMGRLTRDAIEKERAAKGLPPGRRVGQRTMRLLMQS